MRSRQSDDGCRRFIGPFNNKGYGFLGNVKDGKPMLAHRLAWELVGGPIPAGADILHTCDVTACVLNDDEGTYEVNGLIYPRWGHLWLADHLANMRDMAEKQRTVYQRSPSKVRRGERATSAILTEAAARLIRSRYAPVRKMADDHGVSVPAVYALLSGRTWKHLDQATSAV